MDLHVIGDITQFDLSPIVSLLSADRDVRIYIFVNFKSEAMEWPSLEELLMSTLLSVNVLISNGDMDKNQTVYLHLLVHFQSASGRVQSKLLGCNLRCKHRD